MKPKIPDELWTDAGEQVVPLLEEQAHILKRDVVRGRVRVRTVTDSAEERVSAELAGVGFEVTRVPRDEIIAEGASLPTVRKEGDVTILPVLEEVLVVEKRLVLKEEIRIARRDRTETVDLPITLRRQRAIIERIAPDAETDLPTSTKNLEET